MLANIDYRNILTPSVFEIDLITKEHFVFTPGQFITVKTPTKEGGFKAAAFSIASIQKKQNTLTLCIKKHDTSVIGKFLFECPVNTSIEYMGPFGDFTFKSHNAKYVYFIATSTGIAPFMPMIDTYIKHQTQTKFSLIFGVRNESEVFYEDILNVYKRNNRNFDYDIILSQKSGRIPQNINQKTFESGADFYLCGNKNMIEDTENILITKKGIDKHHIFYEKYN